MSKKRGERVGVSEPVERGDGELVRVTERATPAVWPPRGEKRRSCGDLGFSERGGTRARETVWSPFRSGPGGAFRARDVGASATSPAATLQGRDCVRRRLLRLATGERGLGCRGERGTPSGVRTSFGTGALAWLRFRKLFRRLLHSSVLCFPVGCHHSLVNEKLGNFPEGHGENGWPRRNEPKQTLPVPGT